MQNSPMKQQNKVMILCAATCAITKIIFGNSLLAFVSTVVSTFVVYILIKTLMDVMHMPNCSDQYREFLERMKCVETLKQK